MPDNVLASRYASAPLVQIFSAEHRVAVERKFWIAVMEGQRELGVDIPATAIEASRAVVDTVHLDAIHQRELVTRHDVKARVEEFADLAGHQHAHKGMTSRDLTENVEQMLAKEALEYIRAGVLEVLVRLAGLAQEHTAVELTGRSHNVPGQMTTVGKRFANVGEDLLRALSRLEFVTAGLPLRGLKGPMGTSQDQLDLLGHDPQKLDALEQLVREHVGFAEGVRSVGQIYPRSFDFEVVSTLLQLAAGPASLATTLRLMAGHGLATEGFTEGQVGSSAMPHKMNARTCERIVGLKRVIEGYVTMLASVAGDQWNEGDVSCSVVRRVAIPDAFFATDGLIQATIHVLDDLTIVDQAIEAELERHLPFLATTAVLTRMIVNGMGREDAHHRLKLHSLAATKSETPAETLVTRIANDPDIPLTESELRNLLADRSKLIGDADNQVAEFVKAVSETVDRHPAVIAYRPDRLL